MKSSWSELVRARRSTVLIVPHWQGFLAPAYLTRAQVTQKIKFYWHQIWQKWSTRRTPSLAPSGSRTRPIRAAAKTFRLPFRERAVPLPTRSPFQKRASVAHRWWKLWTWGGAPDFSGDRIPAPAKWSVQFFSRSQYHQRFYWRRGQISKSVCTWQSLSSLV